MSTSATEDALAITNQQIAAFELELGNLDQQLADVQAQHDLVSARLASARELKRTLTASLP